MKRFTMELDKIDCKRSLVLWMTDSGTKKYVVCSWYDPSKPFGNQWSNGNYFDNIYDAVEFAKNVREM